MPRPTPGNEAPELSVETIDGEGFTLSERSPEAFTMIVFYRGLHCPVCRKYNEELASKLEKFHGRGVEVIAVSADDAERATESHEKWDVGELKVGYGLSAEQMEDWGLYVSSAIKDSEPEHFSEPGLALVDPEGKLFYYAVNSMPFGRPQFDQMLDAIDFVKQDDYPARGVVEGVAA